MRVGVHVGVVVGDDVCVLVDQGPVMLYKVGLGTGVSGGVGAQTTAPSKPRDSVAASISAVHPKVASRIAPPRGRAALPAYPAASAISRAFFAVRGFAVLECSVHFTHGVSVHFTQLELEGYFVSFEQKHPPSIFICQDKVLEHNI